MLEGQGELITETFDFDGGRKATVFVPVERAEAVVFTTDGQMVPEWGMKTVSARQPATMFVGVLRLAD